MSRKPLPLESLGWNAARDESFRRLNAPDLVPGRVALEHNHVYRVLTAEGEQLAESAGRMKFLASERQALPVVGDWVGLRFDATGARSQIRVVLPRMSWISRKAAGKGTAEQVLAANINTVLIVFGLDKPVNLASIERYLSVARHSHVVPVVVLNKSDLEREVSKALAEAAEAAHPFAVVATNTKSESGIAALMPYLRVGETLALLGPSGVGKSSLVNRLVGRELLPTGEVRAWDSRGRHTSVHRQLVVREGGGLFIDTPGMRELQVWEPDSVDDAFADITDLAVACRFRDCRHEAEPGCAVKAAVDTQALDRRRYEHFLKLQKEQFDVERKREERGWMSQERTRGAKVQPRAPRARPTDREKGKT